MDFSFSTDVSNLSVCFLSSLIVYVNEKEVEVSGHKRNNNTRNEYFA